MWNDHTFIQHSRPLHDPSQSQAHSKESIDNIIDLKNPISIHPIPQDKIQKENKSLMVLLNKAIKTKANKASPQLNFPLGIPWCATKASPIHTYKLLSIFPFAATVHFQQTFMAAFKKFTASAVAAMSVVLLFSNVLALSSNPTITASPAVLPDVTAPNMSSFFPAPSDQWPLNSADPPVPEALAPVPSSGEFIGKSSSGSAKLSGHSALFGVGICIILVIRLVSFV